MITSVVKPVLTVLSLPFILLTLGLFLLVINALLLLLTGWVAGGLGVGFHVDGFWTAVGGSIVITVVTWAVDSCSASGTADAPGRGRPRAGRAGAPHPRPLPGRAGLPGQHLPLADGRRGALRPAGATPGSPSGSR